MGLPLAFAIAGHHAGLANLTTSVNTRRSTLSERLERNHNSHLLLQGDVPTEIWNRDIPPLPSFLLIKPKKSNDAQKRRIAFFTRMLFSALVDADSLATEAFYTSRPHRHSDQYDSLAVLACKLDQRLDNMCSAERTRVNNLRAVVLADCRARAPDKPGCFSLTVPTGGGKTLSSMAFALRHAVVNGLQRVIVVVPYTSIIEQNAAVYRDVLGEQNVVEHHSNLDDFADLEETDPVAIRRRLACENWDAPVIVTTNVQFLESLFAGKKSRCRKLHNIASSVIVFDEAQNMPIGFLGPILDALRDLTNDYGASVVLSTATQPALKRRKELPAGFEDVREIIADPARLADGLRRTNVDWSAVAAPMLYATVAERLSDHRAVLAIVHRRNDAALLTRLVADQRPGEPLFHLSALMCPVHRREAIERIRHELAAHWQDGRPCRVVATQLVEAGVDLDFPVVYRALAGLDSIAQAAGRCNREGRLKQGQVVIFRAETEPPGPTLKRALGQTGTMLSLHEGKLDITSPAIFEEFFSRFYQNEDKDVRRIRTELEQFNFETAEQKFRLIEDDYQQPIVIPWDATAECRIEELQRADDRPFVPRDLLRSLQPYVVQVQPDQFAQLIRAGAVESYFDDTIFVLNCRLFPRVYDDLLGLVVNEERLTPSSHELVC